MTIVIDINPLTGGNWQGVPDGWEEIGPISDTYETSSRNVCRRHRYWYAAPPESPLAGVMIPRLRAEYDLVTQEAAR